LRLSSKRKNEEAANQYAGQFFHPIMQ
jgi:hypothetical protein